MSDELDWAEPSLAMLDDDGRMAVVAHSLLGGVAAIRGAVELALATDLIGANRDSLLVLALSRLDGMTEQLRKLATGLPHASLVMPSAQFTNSPMVDLREGTRVEVHSSFSNTWTPGFEIAEVVIGGYQVRRSSDGSVLPGYTSPCDLRVAPYRA